MMQRIGLDPEGRKFIPHVTLARWKGRRTRELADFLVEFSIVLHKRAMYPAGKPSRVIAALSFSA